MRIPRKKRGFGLLELMLTLAMVSVLAAVAIPAYRGYIERVKVNRAITDIGGLSLSLYRFETNTGSFPASLAAAGLDGIRDPWGRPYHYTNVATASISALRKNRNLIPINSDFDLFSAGPDGVFAGPLNADQSRDDVVRANNGAFIGAAKDY